MKFLPNFKLQNIFIYVFYGTNEEKNKSNIHENANRKILGQKEKLTHKFIVSFQTGSKVFGFIDVSWNFCRLLEIHMEQYGSLKPARFHSIN